MNPKVYLAGPIKGLNYDEATTWREAAKKCFKEVNIDAMSPMRAKGYLKSEFDVGHKIDSGLKDQYHSFPLSTSKAIICRDHMDCTKSNAIIVYLLGAKAVSIGTVMEVAWGYEARVPMILVMEKQGNVHEHCMITEACNFRVESLDEAIHVVKGILLP